MSLPRFNVLVLSLALVASASMVGCSSFPHSKKKSATDMGPQASEQVYYDRAQTALDKGQLSEANKQLEALNSYYPTGQHAQDAQLDLIYTRFKQGDYTGTVSAAESFIRQYPTNPQVDYAYYVRGVANMEQGYDSILRYTSLNEAHRDTSYMKIAYQNFDEFIRHFPSSKYAVDAAQRMTFIGNQIAESEMNVARFNIERKAWVAAVDRGRWVLQNYPQTPQIPEAIATIAYAYGQLGDKQTQQQYIELLKANYPNLIKANGDIDLRAARKKASWVNHATLGLFGRASTADVNKHADKISTETQTAQPTTPEKRSWLNRLSFGTLGKTTN